MRLLWAELRKLHRPLLWGVTLSAMLFSVLLAAGGAANAHRDAQPDRGRGRMTCAQLGLPTGPACDRLQARAARGTTAGRPEGIAAARHTAAQLNPVAAGAEAAGLMSSLPGALCLALLLGGHVGGEWSGRTLKNLLTQQGHRWRVLAAKFASLWLAGAGLVAACWAALAVAGPILVRADHLPDPHQSTIEAVKWAGSQAARSLLVLAAFVAVGLLAAVLTRNTIGSMAACAGAFLGMLVLASLPSAARWTPATWVQGWMGFPVGQRSITDLPNNFWSRFIDASGSPPGHAAGFTGLAVLLVACLAVAGRIFHRSAVSG
jgi:hypothetical protein